MSNKNKIQLPLGIPRWLLFWELFNNSKQLGMGLLQTAGRPQMTLGEAYLEYEIMSNRGEREVYLDYYKGRLIKSLIPTLEDDNISVSFDTWGYDRDHGEGACARIIKGITNKLGGKYQNGMYDPNSQSWFGIKDIEYDSLFLEGLLDNLVYRHIDSHVDKVQLDIRKILAPSKCVIHCITNLDDLVLYLDGVSSGRLSTNYTQEDETYATHQEANIKLTDKVVKKIIEGNPLTIRNLDLG